MECVKLGIKKCIWNKWALLIAGLHFVLSFFTDKVIFQYVVLNFSNRLFALKSLEMIVVKILFFVLLILLWQGIFFFVQKANSRFKKLTIFYLLINLLLLLLTWPGIWRMDEFGLLSSSVQLFPHWWQNYITSVWYIFSLMLLPFPSGVIISLMVIASLLYARFIQNTCQIYQNNIVIKQKKDKKNEGNAAWHEPKWFVFLLTVPFIMFPVLDSNLYPLRMSVYAFLEMTLLSELYLLYQKKRFSQEMGEDFGVSAVTIWIYSCLACVVAVWRMEAIYYVVAYPVLLLFILGFKRGWRQIVVFLIMFVILFVPQKIGEKMTSGQQYELTSIVLPLVDLVIEADQDKDAAVLTDINLVVDTDVIRRAAQEGKNGIHMFWSEPDFQRTYSETEFARFQSAYRKLIFKYPSVFLKERWNTFLASTDLLENTTELFTKKGIPNYETFRSYPLSAPISDSLRTSVIKTLEIRKAENYDEKYAVTDWIYSALIPIVILLLGATWFAMKKQIIPTVILLTALARVPLVFLTAPSRLFMYYYSVYLIGYVFLFSCLAFIFTKKQK